MTEGVDQTVQYCEVVTDPDMRTILVLIKCVLIKCMQTKEFGEACGMLFQEVNFLH